jgi:hypothetical protein
MPQTSGFADDYRIIFGRHDDFRSDGQKFGTSELEPTAIVVEDADVLSHCGKFGEYRRRRESGAEQ